MVHPSGVFMLFEQPGAFGTGPSDFPNSHNQQNQSKAGLLGGNPVYFAHFAGGETPLVFSLTAEARSNPIAIDYYFMKTNKSFTKRIKVTKNGKLIARKPGQNHFNARQTGQQRLARKRTQTLTMSKRITRRFLPKSGA